MPYEDEQKAFRSHGAVIPSCVLTHPHEGRECVTQEEVKAEQERLKVGAVTISQAIHAATSPLRDALQQISDARPASEPEAKREFWGNEDDAESHGYKSACWVLGTIATEVLGERIVVPEKTWAPPHGEITPSPYKLVQLDEDVVFYGPHACESCGKMICRTARSQGEERFRGIAFDYPETAVYPNHEWQPHICSVPLPAGFKAGDYLGNDRQGHPHHVGESPTQGEILRGRIREICQKPNTSESLVGELYGLVIAEREQRRRPSASAPDAGQPSEYPPCSLCGASRIPRGEQGAGTCTLIGCKDPLFDNQVELRQAVMTNPLPEDAAPSAPASAAREIADRLWHAAMHDYRLGSSVGYIFEDAVEKELTEQTRQQREENHNLRAIAEIDHRTQVDWRQRAQAAEAERDKLLDLLRYAKGYVDYQGKRFPEIQWAVATPEERAELDRLRKEAK